MRQGFLVVQDAEDDRLAGNVADMREERKSEQAQPSPRNKRTNQ
jgi:hypothetical protein